VRRKVVIKLLNTEARGSNNSHTEERVEHVELFFRMVMMHLRGTFGQSPTFLGNCGPYLLPHLQIISGWSNKWNWGGRDL